MSSTCIPGAHQRLKVLWWLRDFIKLYNRHVIALCLLIEVYVEELSETWFIVPTGLRGGRDI